MESSVALGVVERMQLQARAMQMQHVSLIICCCTGKLYASLQCSGVSITTPLTDWYSGVQPDAVLQQLSCVPFGQPCCTGEQNACTTQLNRNDPGLASAKCKAVNTIYNGGPEKLEGIRVGSYREYAYLGVGSFGL